MTITQLVNILNNILDEYGDIKVANTLDGEWTDSIKCVSVCKVRALDAGEFITGCDYDYKVAILK